MICICTPPQSLKTNRARLLRLIALCSLALSPVALSGCSQTPPPTDSSPQAPSWGTVLQNWWQASTQTNKTAPSPTPVTASVSSPTQNDIARLARQHPAWKLADALQQNRMAPLSFEAIEPGSVRSGDTLQAPDFDVNFDNAANQRQGNSNSALPEPANSSQPVETPAPHILDFGELNNAARDQQETSLTDFLRSVAVRHEDWQRDYRAILQIALGEEVEAAAQRTPHALSLVLPTPEVQLEMTNLRLRLLRNVFTTEEEREAARNRLRDLLIQWRAALREQESARAQELQRLRGEEPERIRREGLANIEQELGFIRRTQQELRTAIAAEHRTRLEEEFGNERARLALNYPQISPDDILNENPATRNAGWNAVRPAEAIIFNRTLALPRASNATLPGIASTQSPANTARTAQIRALRQQAWNDATRQAKMAARLGY
jgi:hypothetical protein